MADAGIRQTRLYGWLTGDEDSRLCKGISDSACREQPGNFFRQRLRPAPARYGKRLGEPDATGRHAQRVEIPVRSGHDANSVAAYARHANVTGQQSA